MKPEKCFAHSRLYLGEVKSLVGHVLKVHAIKEDEKFKGEYMAQWLLYVYRNHTEK